MQSEMTIVRGAADEVEHLNDLLTAVATDDVEAFVELYRVTIVRIRTKIRRVVLDQALTDDVAQEVFLEIWRGAERFDPALSPAIAWMLRLAHGRAVDQVRRMETARRHEAAQPDRSADQARDPFSESENRMSAAQQVHAGLPQLSARQREALRLVYLEGHTNTTAADRLGISAPAFKSRLRDGLIALRHLLATA